MRRAALFGLVLLAGCGAPDRAPAPQASGAAASATPAPAAMVPAPTPAAAPTAAPPQATSAPPPKADSPTLDSRDCRTVAQAYFDGLARGDYALAARVWSDPTVGEARLKAAFARYRRPTVIIADLQQEGAAGSSYCTVTGMLTDAGDPAKAAKRGQIVLKRVNDVPGATPQQLRWTIRSSTFVEKAGRGG